MKSDLQPVATEDGFHYGCGLVACEEGQVLLGLVCIAWVGDVIHMEAVHLLIGFPLLVQPLLVADRSLRSV